MTMLHVPTILYPMLGSIRLAPPCERSRPDRIVVRAKKAGQALAAKRDQSKFIERMDGFNVSQSHSLVSAPGIAKRGPRQVNMSGY